VELTVQVFKILQTCFKNHMNKHFNMIGLVKLSLLQF